MSAVGWRFDLQRFAASGERTLQPTPRRRQKAREEGRVATSSDLTSAAAMLAASAALSLAAPRGAGVLARWAEGVWSFPAGEPLTSGAALALLGGGVRAGAAVALPVLLAGAGAGALAGMAQSGLAFRRGALVPDLGRLNPAQGLGRIFSRQTLVEMGKALVRLGGTVAVLWGPVHGLLLVLVRGNLGPAAGSVLVLRTLATGMVRVALIMVLVGAADYLFQRQQLESKLRMTVQEMREEMREQDGDPALRTQRRRRQRELSRRRMLTAVRGADVILANPTHVAVALAYDQERMEAPTVVAKGADFMAERIKAVGRAAGVPVVENPPLARSLYGGVRVGHMVPAALYRAVAEVLAYVWRAKGHA